jgi:hypothetical protein
VQVKTNAPKRNVKSKITTTTRKGAARTVSEEIVEVPPIHAAAPSQSRSRRRRL